MWYALEALITAFTSRSTAGTVRFANDYKVAVRYYYILSDYRFAASRAVINIDAGIVRTAHV